MNIYRKRDIPSRLQKYFKPAELGLEPTPEEYVEKMVAVFAEVRRVLRDDGTLWLNIGDSYAAGKAGRADIGRVIDGTPTRTTQVCDIMQRTAPPGLKAKDLAGIPWMLAFALRADGWYLRQEIIWAKPNPMPESCRDRCTKAHESLFLLTKKPRYYYDQEAIKENAIEGVDLGLLRGRVTSDDDKVAAHTPSIATRVADGVYSRTAGTGTRNKRSVWTIATQAFPGSHFATFPEALVVPCIKAGTSEKGCCPECGAPWVRITETVRGPMPEERGGKNYGANATPGGGVSPTGCLRKAGGDAWYDYAGTTTTTGWQPGCECFPLFCGRCGAEEAPPFAAGDACPCGGVFSDKISPCLVLDPFMGAVTVALVARKLDRDYIGVELNPEYIELANKRLRDTLPLFA